MWHPAATAKDSGVPAPALNLPQGLDSETWASWKLYFALFSETSVFPDINRAICGTYMRPSLEDQRQTLMLDVYDASPGGTVRRDIF